ncbi:MAG TPA: hypothetical protein PK698_06455 [Bacilli bacterium]|nr:hypothetical protein [Bacilli bacterium]
MDFKLYNGSVEISFTESNHSYWIKDNGKKRRLAGVTTFIGILDKPAIVPWAVGLTVEYIRDHIADLQSMDANELLNRAKEEANNQRDIAGEIGKAIHAWVEAHIKGDEPEMPDDAKVLQGVVSFLDWTHDHKVEFLDSEKVVYSKFFDYVGTLDLIVKIDGKKYLADIKTGNALYPEVRLQTSAYLKAYEEESGEKLDGRIAIRISKETEEEYKARMEKKGKTDYPEYKIFEAVMLDEDENLLEQDFSGFINCLDLYRWKSKAKI